MKTFLARMLPGERILCVRPNKHEQQNGYTPEDNVLIELCSPPDPEAQYHTPLFVKT